MASKAPPKKTFAHQESSICLADWAEGVSRAPPIDHRLHISPCALLRCIINDPHTYIALLYLACNCGETVFATA